MTDLVQIKDDDRYLDFLGTCIPLLEELRDDLAGILAGWIKEVREAPWQPTSSELPGS